MGGKGAIQSTKFRGMFLGITLSTLFLQVKIPFSNAELSLPFPSLIKEMEPTLTVFSTTADPPCFRLEGGGSATAKDLVRMANGHGAFAVPRVILITHGYRDSGDDQWLHVMKNALIHERPQTVIIVGWGGGADLPHIKYKKAAGNLKSLGIWLGEIVEELRTIHPTMIIWGIGHSLGAHLMGLAGRHSPGAFNRITALDPAGPFFETKNLDMRLHRGDASIVDVIHPDGCKEELIQKCWVQPNNHYGTLMPLGNIDFYPNFGVKNPTTNLLDIDEAHKRAVDLFILSILHRGLFKTNETLDGTPGYGSAVEKIRPVQVTAEMGYWLDSGFVPGPTDSRVNFYISDEVIKVVERLGDVVELVTADTASKVHHHDHHAHGMRHRRSLVKSVDCMVVPGGGALVKPSFYFIILSISAAFYISNLKW